MEYVNEWRKFFNTLPYLAGKRIKIETYGMDAKEIVGNVLWGHKKTQDELDIVLSPMAMSRRVHPIDRKPLGAWLLEGDLVYTLTSHYFSIDAPEIWQNRSLHMPIQSFPGKITILLRESDTFKKLQHDQMEWQQVPHLTQQEVKE